MAKATAKKTLPYTVKRFYLEDQPKTLFPLSTNRLLVEKGSRKIGKFCDELIANDQAFLPQITVHANKDARHLRRTVKLDVVAEWFLYRIIHKNRTRFRKPHSDEKRHFGYRFVDGLPQQPSTSFRDFKVAIWSEGALMDQEHFLTFDISSYFNNLYHHDLHAWFSSLEPAESDDVVHFGKFLREIKAGRSLDCLPQGLYPAKMIGNDFLRFIENNCLIKSRSVYRFMDDICLIDDSTSNLQADFDLIQKLLGQKGLSINSAKTRIGDPADFDEAEDDIEELKKRLLQRRRKVIISHYDFDDDDDDDDDLGPLSEAEIQFAIQLLSRDKISEEDAELVLIVMRDHVNRISDHLSLFARDFPHLAKHFYFLCSEADDKDNVTSVLLDILGSGAQIGEYQLFWFGMMLERYLLSTKRAGELVAKLYTHSNSTDISRAKILEIQDNRFGLAEFRDGFLREGRSDWHSWASAAGSLALKDQSRNYLLGYFRNGSPMNALIADILTKSA